MAPTLLLLEDDPAIARTVAYALERDGFRVEHVLLVQEARQRLKAGGYAAALLDIGLPDGNGLDLCRELRAEGALPVILLSARDEEMDRVLGLELGADDYVSKPFSPRELSARVRSLVRRSAMAPTAAAPSARLVEHDEPGCRIRIGDAWLKLTRLEYKLLSTLLKRPGHVWSRDALLDAAWGHGADSHDRTVDTHVKTLRAKLREACPARELIVTHRGMGYSIDLGA